MGTLSLTRQRSTPVAPSLETTWHGFGGWFGSVPARMLRVLVVWQQRANQRHALSRLDARMLSDIGLSRAEAEREYRKPFWQA